MKKLRFAFITLIACAGMFTGTVKADDDAALAYMALSHSSVSLSSLINKVSDVYSGFVLEAEFDDYKDKSYGYEITLVDIDAQQVRELFFSLQSGELLDDRTRSLSWLGFNTLDKKERIAIESLAKANMDIPRLINDIETRYRSHLIELELEHQMGITYYEVDLFSPEKGRNRLLVNVETGQEIPLVKQH